MDAESMGTSPEPDEETTRSTTAEGASGTVASRSLPESQPVTSDIPGLSYLHDATSTETVYCEMLSSAAEEIVVFNRPPYAWALPELHPTILELLGRGVPTRALYRRKDLEHAEAATFRKETEAYIEAGLQARVVEEMPAKMLVMDRRAALLAMMDPTSPEEQFPPSLHVEHPGLARSLADVFEQYWAPARPYVAEPVRE